MSTMFSTQAPPNSEAAKARLAHAAAVESVRSRGWRGGLILRHRAFQRLEPSASDLIGGAAALVGLSLLWARLLGPIGQFWRAMFAFWARPLGLDSTIIMVPQQWGAHLHFALPYLSAPAGPITPTMWSVTAVASVVALISTYFMGEEMLPLVYLLRALVLIQSGALVYFAFFSARFPHDIPSYTVGMLVFGVILIGLVPVILAFTFYVFDFSFLKKVGLTLITMAHLTLLVPLQYLLHIWILHHSILFMPILYFAFGPFLDILVFVSLYSWGMSWRTRRDYLLA
ncbi:MAG TPA: hypothetical protein VE998_06580 [Terriglobales bacterium]|nr:hypothetical protein [Terriglobales bacterium]